MGAIERGTTFRAYMEIKVHPKNKLYALITKGLRYSFIFESYFLFALFLKLSVSKRK